MCTIPVIGRPFTCADPEYGLPEAEKMDILLGVVYSLKLYAMVNGTHNSQYGIWMGPGWRHRLSS